MSDESCTPPAQSAPRFRPKREPAIEPPIGWAGRAEYGMLESRILAAFRSDLAESEFDSIALELHAFQKRWNEPYARWCAALPQARSWRGIPAIPQAMFKRFRIACFPAALPARVFRTSGTTGETRGEHHLPDTRIYEASVLAGWDRCGFPGHYQLVLSPTAEEAPDSSLAHMWKTTGSRATHHATFVRADGSLASAQLAHTLDCFTTRGRPAPVALLGTALAFLNFFEQQPGFRARLAEGSFIIETGGFKGSDRDIAKVELYRMFEERLGVAPGCIWNEYGMCELGSQFYTRGIGGVHEAGPWARALVVSAETGAEVQVGEMGVLRIFDLSNAASVLAIQTADLAIRRERGFELVGRDPAAIPRGCSRMADEFARSPQGTRGAVTSTTFVGVIPLPRHRPETSTAFRAAALAEAASQFDFLGRPTAQDLLSLVTAELCHAEALDRFIPRAGHASRAIPPQTILHIMSGNTPAAALQTLMRGLLLGSHNLCKLPSSGLPEVAQFASFLPAELARSVEIATPLSDDWLARAEVVIVFGNDATIASLRQRCRPDQVFIPHGHKVSLGIFFDPPRDYTAAARAASIFDQQGCLSPHVFFVRESDECSVLSVAQKLALAMETFNETSPRLPISVSEANSIRTLRDECAFRAANGEPFSVFASDDTHWTVIADSTAGFPHSPLNRVVFVKPLPDDLAAVLAPIRPHLSTCGIWPATDENAEIAASLGVTRVCPIGMMQHPPLTWHHDGQSVLAPLVRWLDFERE